MDAHELHGELFEGEGAMDLGIIRVGDNIGLTAVVHGGVSGTRVHLPPQRAREAWHYLGELLGFPGAFNAEEMAVLNSLVTFAVEQLPAVAPAEAAIARKVGSATLRMAGPPDARRAFAEHHDVEPDELPPSHLLERASRRLADSRLGSDELRRLNEDTGFDTPEGS